METKKVNVKIVGTCPYIQHRFVNEEKKGRGKTEYPADKEAEKGVYKNDKGFYVPSTHIKMSMVNSAKEFKIKGKKTYKDYIKAGVLIQPEIQLSNKKYEIFETPVVIQRARIMRARPMFREWEAEFELEIIDDLLQPSIVKEILESAGRFTGIGDQRPEYGRFRIEKFEVVKD